MQKKMFFTDCTFANTFPWQKIPFNFLCLFFILMFLVACGETEASEPASTTIEISETKTATVTSTLSPTATFTPEPTVVEENNLNTEATDTHSDTIISTGDVEINNEQNIVGEDLEPEPLEIADESVNASDDDELVDVTTLIVTIPELDSYRMSVEVNNMTEIDGVMTENVVSIEMINNTEPSMFFGSMIAPVDTIPRMEITELDNTVYIVIDNGVTVTCDAVPSTEIPNKEEIFPIAPEILFDLSLFALDLGVDLPKLKYVGLTRINDIDVNEYILLDTPDEETSMTLRAYLAKEGNYLVSFSLFDSDLMTGETTVTKYDLLDVNEPLEILLPAECDNSNKVVIYPNSTIMLESRDIIMYETNATEEELIAFYQEKMPLAGWTYSEEESDQANEFSEDEVVFPQTSLLFTNETHFQVVTITVLAEGVLQVTLMQNLLQPPSS